MIQRPIIVEQTYNASIDKVWKSITDKDAMKQWYFDLPEFNAKVGCEFKFYGGPPETQYLHICKITEVVPCKKITYSWLYDGYEGKSYVTFELFEEANKMTRIKLTHADLETFPSSNPDFAKQNFIEGWNHIIGTSLKEFVEKA